MALRFQQKLTIPVAARSLVQRTALVQQLDEAVTTRRLVVLAAPAGWGKTTLMTQWAATTALPVAWYTLDDADHDPQRFLDYLLHTVAPFVPGAIELAARIDSSSPQSLAEVAHEAALLIADAPTPFALVLDDLQLLTDGPSLPGSTLVIDLLASVVEYATNCHPVLASRTVPELRGLVRLIAQQRAAVFDYALLQFQIPEVQQLALMTGRPQVGDEEAEHLTTQFGGWVTGIMLSLDKSIHSHYQSSFDGVSDTSKVYAYFAEQVVSPLPADFQQFLEETSVLEALSAERCDQLRGTTDARDYLELIQRHSLFVSARGEWLTYHSLFRDFLRTRLGRDALRARRLLLRAAEMYRNDDDLERAVDCFLAARAEDQAIALLREATPRFRQRSSHTTLIACFNRLDQGKLLPADLLLEQARVYSDLALWEQAFVAIELAQTLGDKEIRLEACIAQADMEFLRGNLDAAQTALNEIPFDSLPASLRINYAIVAGKLQVRRNQTQLAIETLEAAIRLTNAIEGVDGPATVGVIADVLGLAYARQGERAPAQRYLRRADACWQALGNAGRRAMTLNNLGMIAMEEQRYTDARNSFEMGLENASRTARRRTEATLLCSLGELELHEGNTSEAILRFDAAYALASRLYIAASAALAAVGAWCAAVIAGNEPAARRWEAAANVGKESASPDIRCRATLTRSRAYRMGIGTERLDMAQAVAEVQPFHEGLAAIDQVELALQEAVAAYDTDDHAAAKALWRAAEERLSILPSALRQQLVAPYQFITQLHQPAVLVEKQAQNGSDTVVINATETWHVMALGMFTCTHNDTVCELTPIYQALLVRLLDAGPAGLTVDRLWESVWGDSELSMTALHQALRRLRAQTGLAVSARDGLCVIRSPWNTIEYDVRIFETALASEPTSDSLERAVSLYRGEFLPSAPVSATLWATARRDTLQHRYLDALEQLAALHEKQTPQTAIYHYQRILQIDGCREQTAMRLMRLAAQIGNRSLVNTTYEHLRLALRTLGVAPSETTSDVYRQLA